MTRLWVHGQRPRSRRSNQMMGCRSPMSWTRRPPHHERRTLGCPAPGTCAASSNCRHPRRCRQDAKQGNLGSTTVGRCRAAHARHTHGGTTVSLTIEQQHRTACRCCRVYVNGQALEIDICTRMQAHPLPYSSDTSAAHWRGAGHAQTAHGPHATAQRRASAHENTHSHRDTAAQDTGWLLRSPTRCRLLARTAALKGRMARRARWGLPNNASSLAVLSSTRTRLSW